MAGYDSPSLRRGCIAGNDFEVEPRAGHDFEIFISTSTAWMK